MCSNKEGSSKKYFVNEGCYYDGLNLFIFVICFKLSGLIRLMKSTERMDKFEWAW